MRFACFASLEERSSSLGCGSPTRTHLTLWRWLAGRRSELKYAECLLMNEGVVEVVIVSELALVKKSLILLLHCTAKLQKSFSMSTYPSIAPQVSVTIALVLWLIC